MRKLWLAVVCFSVSISARGVQIISTADLHGAVNSGSVTRFGGINGIAEVLSGQRNAGDLLVDAGGFCAGGIYDIQTAGKVSDSIRSELVVQAMIDLDYNAVTFGDDDLARDTSALIRWVNEGLPVVSANVSVEGVAIPQSKMIAGDVPVFITAVTTNCPLFVAGKGVEVKPILSSLESVLHGVDDSTFVVLLAHCTPEEISSLIQSFPQIDLIIRGHRVGTGSSIDTVWQKPVVGFHVGGDRIASSDIARLGSVSSHWLEIPSKMKGIIQVPDGAVVVDCYVMSGCRFGVEAIRELLKIREIVGDRVELDLSFSGTIRGDSLVPGMQSGSLEEELLVVAMRENFPERFNDFLWLWSSGGGSASDVIHAMEINRSHLNRWISIHGALVLKSDYIRAERLNVSESPAIFVNNRRYERGVYQQRFLFDLCENVPSLALCDQFGECFDHEDCESDSVSVGRCESAGNGVKSCKTYRENPFRIVQVLPNDSTYTEQNSFTESTKLLFPSAQIQTVRPGNRMADSLLFFFRPEMLPWYLFDSTVVSMKNFDQVASNLNIQDDYFIVNPELSKGNFYCRRPAKPREQMLFLDYDSPLWKQLHLQFSQLHFFPDFRRYNLANSVVKNEIESLLQKSGVDLSAEQFFETYLADISVKSPVWLLENNQKVHQFNSLEELYQWTKMLK